MNIPSLKKVNIVKGSLTELHTQLNQVNFERSPLVLNISHLENQITILEQIEEYINQNEIRLVPYPVFILVSQEVKSTELIIIKDIKETPVFFNQKIKPLNLKENALLKKISLLQEKIRSNNLKRSQNIFKDYSQVTKEIKKLEKQSQYMNQIILKSE